MRALALVVVVAACGRDHFDPAHNLAFVTSTVHDPLTFGSDGAGADAICAQTATAAGIAGDYRAYIATAAVPATDHLGNARGWIRVDGKPVADLVTDLQSGHLLYPLRIDENGEDLGPGAISVATGADLGGQAAPTSDCLDWTSTTGNFASGAPSATGLDWVNARPTPCTSLTHLYCFGVGLSTPLEITPAPGRLAFVTIQAYVPTGGLAGADALCATEAAGASLPGSFRALLATNAASAISRFDLTGPTWVRTDGAALAESALAFANEDLLTAPNITALAAPAVKGSVVSGGPIGSPQATTCSDWTGGGSTSAGSSMRASSAAFDGSSVPCTGLPIYCLAQ